MSEIIKFKVTQIRTLLIEASHPGDAADAARFLFDNREVPADLRRHARAVRTTNPRVIRLEVEETND